MEHEARMFIASYDMLEREGRLDLLSVKMTMMKRLKEVLLQEGKDDALIESMMFVASLPETPYN